MTKQPTDSDDDFRVFFPDSDLRCTEAFSKFVREFRSHTEFFFFICDVVGKMDSNRIRAAKALLSASSDKESREKYEATLKEPEFFLNILSKYAKTTSQNLTNGIVNSFQRYFSLIIQEAALKMPIILSSSQTVKIDDVLKFSKHRDLVEFIIDRKINELSYGGLTEMEKYFDDRLGVKMFSDPDEKNLLRIFIESRNINVHNGAIANHLFASRVGVVDGFPYKIGEVFQLDLDELSRLASNAMKVALKIDFAVSSKFNLRRKKSSEWEVRH